MNCQEFLRHVEDELLFQPDAALEKLRAHLAACEQNSCRESLEEMLTVDQAVRAWRQQVPEIDVTETVVSEWRNGRVSSPATGVSRPAAPASTPRSLPMTSPPPPASRAWPVILAVAALMLMLPLLVPNRSGDSRPAIAPPVAAVHGGRPAGQPDPGRTRVGNEPHTEIVRDRSIAYYNAAQHATRMVTDAVVLVLPDDDPSSQFEDPTHVPEWVGRWEEQIEPLKTQFDSAVRSLMDVLPEPMPAT